MKNLVLIGMMGCGKSTVGALLAHRLGRELADTDQLIEAREGCTIPELFVARGEEYFREREREVAWELAGREDLVIACGGGLHGDEPLGAENQPTLLKGEDLQHQVAAVRLGDGGER